MSKKSKLWKILSGYLLPCALGVLIVHATYSQAVSSTQESGSGMSDAASVPDAVPNPYSPELKDVFFDRGSFQIRDDAKPVLDENAQALESEPFTYVVIESHCDAREESPASLGIKRGNAVKEYLLGRGIEAERVLTVNKCNPHEMKPAGGKETVSLERRVHFVALDRSTGRDILALAE